MMYNKEAIFGTPTIGSQTLPPSPHLPALKLLWEDRSSPHLEQGVAVRLCREAAAVDGNGVVHCTQSPPPNFFLRKEGPPLLC